MSDPIDRAEVAPPEDRPGLRRSSYAILGVSGVVLSTVFAAVAAFANGGSGQSVPTRVNEEVQVGSSRTTGSTPTTASSTST
ncbi:hypothetical protein L6E12_17110, partial [Actinokineospora sp. PR83]|uniref:hypothetical protein n=1 Tax=Actinokineospora sp. PR83 TaxID=2884908 RepID=UPI0035ABC9D0|nr:hypothetical protein [Actinokineospora sp. PR83]